ncbi:hypothetical protein OGR47_12650 [Methylocystis sp. MJC1]|uniref:hypothetical protein n=1 Tax=Methylocystis sp. MJC1 TaxID=2654282 RepID=UPI0013E9A9AE|nr:hypothetical protein [Methylocystis sp. MJC1]KAF2990937.1 hypothetical protein MJC1_02035 [Methylocystis sp. MJC1]MBU6527831.1 hypothetical protein [Methylocystis sp. MJC1]UZX10757.1 hypothetical protein OGR47_12650 [Methylocystis sp. MJC1]
MAKKKPQASKTSSAGLAVAVGLACGTAGYFLGKHSASVEQSVSALVNAEKPAAPAAKTAPEQKRADAPGAIKTADKSELARLLKGAATKPAEPKGAAEEIPTPPAKPDLALRAEPPKPDDAEPDSAKPDPVRPDFPHPPAPIAFTFLNREISQSGDAGARVTLSLNFENLAGKAIRAFEGVMKLTDQQDRNIYSTKIAVSALISEGGAIRWDEQIDAGKLDEKSRRLVSEDRDNLKAVFLVKKVFFVDGSVRKFDARG